MWNHRVIEKNGMFGIHEVYYNEGKIVGITEEAIQIKEDDLESLEATILRIRDCLEYEVLKYEDISKKEGL